jgi:hypothetical protein
MSASDLAKQHLEDYLDRTRLSPGAPEPVLNSNPYEPHYQARSEEFVPRQRAEEIVEGGGGGCPHWQISVVDGGVVIGQPGTVGALVPHYDDTPLTDSPPPVVPIPTGEGRYLLYFALGWEPERAEVFPGEWFMGTGGTLTDVEVVVAAEGSPPVDVMPEIDGATGGVDTEGLQHVVFAMVDRGAEDGGPGEISVAHVFLCGGMEWKICGRRVLLGPKS